MALPSQTERSAAAGRTFVNKNRRRGARGALVGGALLMIGAGALVVYLLRPDKRLEPAAVMASQTVEPAARLELLADTGAEVRQPEPLTIRQGLAARPEERPASTGPAPVKPPDRATPPDSSKPAPVDLTVGAVAAPGTPAGAARAAAGSPALPASSSTDAVRLLIDEGDRLLAAGDAVGARRAYNQALGDPRTVRADQEALRTKLTRLNEELLFSPKVTGGDTLVTEYTVASGDNPSRIARRLDLTTEASLIARINKADPRRLRLGQKLKLVHGPFHAVVHKADYRLDLYQGSPDDQAGWIYIRSFPVGLGADNGTPVGVFAVKSGSKLVNPYWTNPRTGERFAADDPKNPIGEHWIGIEGLGTSAVHTGFGLHGTIEPDSIGQQKSMGCVRLGAEDIALLYDLLVEKVSVVRIEP